MKVPARRREKYSLFNSFFYPQLAGIDILTFMKNMPFSKIFMITLCVFTVPTFVLVKYLEETRVIEGIGLGNTVMTGIVVSMLPALLVSIWWWNRQDEE